MKNNGVMDWMLRLVKGIFVGTGFILPGVSGGALAAIFGLYERLISFVAHLTKDFKSNLLFFLPVGIGMLAGIVLLAYPLEYCLEHFEAPTIWFFIGAILGIFPSLWQQAGKKGRQPKHLGIMAAALAVGFSVLLFVTSLSEGQVPQNFYTWLMAGALIALGVLAPGFSPSNFLIFMGLYTPMVAAFKALNLSVLLPIGIGGLLCMLAFSKLVDWGFQKAYTGLFHIIVGVVIASTLVIVPREFNYLSWGTLVCLGTCLGGFALGYWMSTLEKRYKPEKD